MSIIKIISGHIVVFNMKEYFLEPDMSFEAETQHAQTLTEVLIMAGLAPSGVGMVDGDFAATFLTFEEAKQVLTALQFGRREVIERMEQKLKNARDE